ncbi:hypothetical protein QJS66_23290 (plasmid) [Kocuria rhizophila]|nr:hypothetical protein QJS66_23290 [Kocuria rhizophila]
MTFEGTYFWALLMACAHPGGHRQTAAEALSWLLTRRACPRSLSPPSPPQPPGRALRGPPGRSHVRGAAGREHRARRLEAMPHGSAKFVRGCAYSNVRVMLFVSGARPGLTPQEEHHGPAQKLFVTADLPERVGGDGATASGATTTGATAEHGHRAAQVVEHLNTCRDRHPRPVHPETARRGRDLRREPRHRRDLRLSLYDDVSTATAEEARQQQRGFSWNLTPEGYAFGLLIGPSEGGDLTTVTGVDGLTAAFGWPAPPTPYAMWSVRTGNGPRPLKAVETLRAARPLAPDGPGHRRAGRRRGRCPG